ncbi:MAG TPA: hypothetical protein VGP26_16860 [Actinophytocola sp.]|nr:hypothetical protein [Actinophytocola sp.]
MAHQRVDLGELPDRPLDALEVHLEGSAARPADYVACWLVLAACWAAGAWVRGAAARDAERRRLAEEAVVAAERARIAREPRRRPRTGRRAARRPRRRLPGGRWNWSRTGSRARWPMPRRWPPTVSSRRR